jgi:hypothetical protein
MKTSRTVFSEINKKAGSFPFTLRSLDNEQRARMGVQEAVAHGLLKPYDIVQTASGSVVAEFFFTSKLLLFFRCQDMSLQNSRPSSRRSFATIPQPSLVLCVSLALTVMIGADDQRQGLFIQVNQGRGTKISTWQTPPRIQKVKEEQGCRSRDQGVDCGLERGRAMRMFGG